jgi:hypothetical protein
VTPGTNTYTISCGVGTATFTTNGTLVVED